MLIAQSPLRVSLFGGGSDLPDFLERHAGAVLSFAINQRVFIIGHPFTHRQGIALKYSQTEDVIDAHKVRHPIAREIMLRYGIDNLDIAVMSDVPAGTGLGSSSSFTIAFLAFVRHYLGLKTTAADLAREACDIEVGTLKEPIGYQDQWACALGGINVLSFLGQEVRVEAINVPASSIETLQSSLHLVRVGTPRSASELLARQRQALVPGSVAEKLTLQLVDFVELGRRAMLTDMEALGPLLDESWALKRQLSSGISNAEVDTLYGKGIRAGATGGKLLGAGGSGFVAFYVPSDRRERFETAFSDSLRYRVCMQGAGIIHES